MREMHWYAMLHVLTFAALNTALGYAEWPQLIVMAVSWSIGIVACVAVLTYLRKGQS